MGNQNSTKKSKRKNCYQIYTPIIKDISVQLKVEGKELPFNDNFEGILKIEVTTENESESANLMKIELKSNVCTYKEAKPKMLAYHWLDSKIVFTLTTKLDGVESETLKVYTKFEICKKEFHVYICIPNNQKNQKKLTTFTVTIEEMPLAVQCLHKEILCQEESNFITERTKIIFQKMQNQFGTRFDFTSDDVPHIAIIGSGGGLRALVGMSGVMTALKKENILDYVMYTAGLSGSAWYLMTLYVSGLQFDNSRLTLDPERVNRDLCQKLKDFKDHPLKMAIEVMQNYRKRDSDTSEEYVTVANAFGEKIGELLIKEECHYYWSDLANALNNGSVPLPLIAAVHVRDQKTLITHHEWIEFSPYQVFIPRFGVAIYMENFGKTFEGGYVTDENGIKPIHFLLGMCGSAFAIFRDYRPQGYEWNPSMRSNKLSMAIYLLFNNFDKQFVGTVPNFLYGIEGIDKLPEDTDEDGETSSCIWDEYWRKFLSLGLDFCELWPIVWAILNGENLLSIRPGDIHYRDCSIIEKFIRTLFSELSEKIVDVALLISEHDPFFGNQEGDTNDLKQRRMMLVDAGISFNSPYPTVLRPNREVELIFSFDFSYRNADTDWPFKELEKAAKWARKKGVPFPNVQRRLRRLAMEWKVGIRKEMYVFPGGEFAPTIIHFVMINESYKKIDSFDIHSKYSTLKFNYDDKDFSRLNSLFQHNVEINMEMIKFYVQKHIRDKKLRNKKKEQEAEKKKKESKNKTEQEADTMKEQEADKTNMQEPDKKTKHEKDTKNEHEAEKKKQKESEEKTQQKAGKKEHEAGETNKQEADKKKEQEKDKTNEQKAEETKEQRADN